MGQNNQWLKPVLAQGVAMLLLLRLKNSPTEEVIQPTLEAWYQVITYKKNSSQRRELQILIFAFLCRELAPYIFIQVAGY